MAFAPRLLLLALLVAPGFAAQQESGSYANPMRRVVSMLQMMQKKVTEEGKKEAELYDKFKCFCKTGSSDLGSAIAAAESKITQDTSSLTEAKALKDQLASELVQHKSDRADANEAVAKATALREKEAAAYAKESSELKTNIAALAKAIAALEKGVTGGFLQTSEAATLQRIALDAEMSTTDRDMLSSFLSTGQGQAEGYVPQSGQIIGILKEIKDTMEKSLADANAEEAEAIENYNALVAAKTKEIKANQAAIESKTERVGQLAVDIVNFEEALDDTTKSLLADQKFLADLGSSCADKKAEWEARSKTRAEELLALAETIKILNDDDALELFKKTLPSPSALLQTAVSEEQVKQRALQALQSARGGRNPKVELIALALRGNTGGFEKVVKMIDSMVALLAQEQTGDDEKKAYCEAELDKSDDDKKGLDQKSADLEKAIEQAAGTIATLIDEIAALEAGVKELDNQVADATANRKAEHELHVQTMTADGAAKELITLAKNRLAKFYSPELYKPPPARVITEEERISSNMGIATTTPPAGGIAGTGVTYIQTGPMAFVQVSSHAHGEEVEAVAPPPAPDTWGSYAAKGEEHTGVIEMLGMLMTDLDKEMAASSVDEKDAQAEYEVFMSDSAAKRSTDVKSIANKVSTKADLEGEKQKLETEHKATVSEAMAKAEYIHNLHLDCDWLLANFEVRKAARAGEIQSLKDAKAVLTGADYSFAELSSQRHASLRGGRS